MTTPNVSLVRAKIQRMLGDAAENGIIRANGVARKGTTNCDKLVEALFFPLLASVNTVSAFRIAEQARIDRAYLSDIFNKQSFPEYRDIQKILNKTADFLCAIRTKHTFKTMAEGTTATGSVVFIAALITLIVFGVFIGVAVIHSAIYFGGATVMITDGPAVVLMLAMGALALGGALIVSGRFQSVLTSCLPLEFKLQDTANEIRALLNSSNETESDQ